jgi:hypothetical protein
MAEAVLARVQVSGSKVPNKTASAPPQPRCSKAAGFYRLTLQESGSAARWVSTTQVTLRRQSYRRGGHPVSHGLGLGREWP